MGIITIKFDRIDKELHNMFNQCFMVASYSLSNGKTLNSMKFDSYLKLKDSVKLTCRL